MCFEITSCSSHIICKRECVVYLFFLLFSFVPAIPGTAILDLVPPAGDGFLHCLWPIIYTGQDMKMCINHSTIPAASCVANKTVLTAIVHLRTHVGTQYLAEHGLLCSMSDHAT